MKIDDREIKKILQDDTVKMDDEQKRRLDFFLENLPEKEIQIEKEPVFTKRTRQGTGWKAAFAMMTLLVILPNVNPTIAYAMYELPLIGKLFEVVTIRNYEYQDETHEVEIKMPEVIVNEAESEGINELNKESQEFVNLIIEEFESELTEGVYQAICVDYEVLCNTEEWFTLKLNVAEVMASSDEYYKYYHIDKKTGELVELSGLFVNDDYIDAISDNIYQQMLDVMENDEDGSVDYWVEKADEDVEACYIIDADQNFYFNESGDIVIVYDKYTVGPGSMGCPEFTISKEIYEKYLK